jgi:hypothetical protein
LVKYGGGDWYANPTSLPNLIRFCNSNINTTINPKPATVEPNSPSLLSYPFLHMTGHGNVVLMMLMSVFKKLPTIRRILHIDDNYGWTNTLEKK